MNTAQARANAVSRKRSLLMTIRMNKGYKGYSSFAGGHSASDRLRIIAECEVELKSLVIPEIKTEITGYAFEEPNGDYIGAIYNPDLAEAIENVMEYAECTESELKYETITKTF